MAPSFAVSLSTECWLKRSYFCFRLILCVDKSGSQWLASSQRSVVWITTWTKGVCWWPSILASANSQKQSTITSIISRWGGNILTDFEWRTLDFIIFIVIELLTWSFFQVISTSSASLMLCSRHPMFYLLFVSSLIKTISPAELLFHPCIPRVRKAWDPFLLPLILLKVHMKSGRP